jgi:hypothetical protein
LITNLLFWEAFLYVIGTVIMTTLTALSGVDWSEAAPQTRLMIVLGVVGASCITLRAYINQSISRLVKGDLPTVDTPNLLSSTPPFPPGTTEKQTVTSQVTRSVTTPPDGPA